MLKRLVVGLLKGAVLGAAIGAGLHYGLKITHGGVLLGYLVAMASASTTGVLAGKAPWRRDAGIETILKAIAGLGVGALFYFVVSRYAAFKVPFAVPTLPADAKWTEIPMLVSIGAGKVFGMLVELDNTDAGDEPPRNSKAPSKPSHGIEDAELVPSARGVKSNVRR